MKNSEINRCPVCGSEVDGEFDICKKCGWENDLVQKDHPDFRGGANEMSLNEAREAYRRGEKIQ